MLERFFPDEYMDSTYSIDFEKLYSQGFRGIIFDIDNHTLVPHGAPADKRAEELFRRLKEIGFSCCLLSNNQYERVSSFNKNIQVHFIENAHKPGRKKLSESYGTDGDQSGKYSVHWGSAFYRCIRCEKNGYA